MKQQPPREITINACLNGFIVRVGCQTLVFTTLSSLISELHKYLTGPLPTEREYINAALYDTMRERQSEVARIVNDPCCDSQVAVPTQGQPVSLDQERRTRDPILR